MRLTRRQSENLRALGEGGAVARGYRYHAQPTHFSLSHNGMTQRLLLSTVEDHEYFGLVRPDGRISSAGIETVRTIDPTATIVDTCRRRFTRPARSSSDALSHRFRRAQRH